MTRIEASAVVSAAPGAVFAFLAELHNHWNLAPGKIELVELGEAEDGSPRALVTLRGPLGIRRRARTRVLRVEAPSLLGGVAQVGERTRAEVRWELAPAGSGRTHVALSAVISAAGRGDRLLLRAGGAIWLRRVFASTLRVLAERLHAARTDTALEAA